MADEQQRVDRMARIERDHDRLQQTVSDLRDQVAALRSQLSHALRDREPQQRVS